MEEILQRNCSQKAGNTYIRYSQQPCTHIRNHHLEISWIFDKQAVAADPDPQIINDLDMDICLYEQAVLNVYKISVAGIPRSYTK